MLETARPPSDSAFDAVAPVSGTSEIQQRC